MPQFQNESKCETIQMKMSLILHENELVDGTHFHMNGFALRLVLTRKQKGTRKWPIIFKIGHDFFFEPQQRFIE